MKEIHLIANPIAGRGNCANIMKQIKDWATTQKDLNLVIHETENEGHAIAISRDLTSRGLDTTILVLGGDGTLNEVINGINDFEKTTIGVLPYGSGNDFFKALGMSDEDPLFLVNSYITSPEVKKIDYLLINDKYRCLNVAGLGLSAEVIAYRNKMKHFSPKTQYKLATTLKSLFWKAFDYKVVADGKEPQDIKSLWFTMNNGRYIGGGLLSAPEAVFDDGLITVSYIKKFNRFKTIGNLVKCKKNKVDKVKERVMFNCKEIKITGHAMNLEYDGNLISGLDYINVKIIPHKVNILIRK